MCNRASDNKVLTASAVKAFSISSYKALLKHGSMIKPNSAKSDTITMHTVPIPYSLENMIKNKNFQF